MTRIILVLIIMVNSAALFAQNTVLQTRLSTELENATLEEILKDISTRTGTHFSYNSRALHSEKRITIKAVDEPLEYILNILSREYNLEYKLVKQQVVLQKAPEKPKAKPRFTISGHIRDKTSAETLPGATVMVKELNTGTTSNAYGFFSLSLPEGEYELIFSFVGYQMHSRTIALDKNIRFQAELEPDTRLLSEIIIKVDEDLENLSKSQSSHLSVSPKSLEGLPQFAGENGLIKSLQTLPGIQTHSDGSSFFFVRGGNKDHNLILIDEAPVYNPAHLFGFYSVIIPDVAKSINIYKADMPIDKAGRLSSVIDVQTRDGNMKNFSMEGVLNPLMYRFSVESPISKEKSSFFASYRRSNFEWLYRQDNPDSDLFIRDLNARINWRINDKNRIYFAFFHGKDNYTTMEQQGTVGLGWHNSTSTVRWNHIFGPRLFSNATLYTSNYNYRLFTGNFPWESGIENIGLKYDLSYFVNPELSWKFGFAQTTHQINPGNIDVSNENLSPLIPKVYAGKASETAFYINREKRINERWTWNAGLRMPVWVHKGPAVVFGFDEDYLPADTLMYANGKTIKSYINLDIRLSAGYRTGKNSSLRFSWGTYHQYVHLLSNSISPFSSFEIWMPSGQNIKPQRARQVTAGFTKRLPSAGLEFVTEIYNKRMFNQIEYNNHAKLLLNPLIEGELRFGESHAYGMEISLRRNQGRLTGWASYTWSRVFNQFEDINNNQQYPAFYDRPHDLSLFLSWQASKRINISANWIYYTGSAITTPVGFYNYNGNVVPLYGQKNNDRLPDYHRLDFSLTYRFGKPTHRYQHSLNFAIFNLYNRHNPISVNFNKVQTRNGNFVVPANLYGTQQIMSTQKYLGGIMPSITYQFKIQ